ncbi:hypothetical protein B738_05899 [Photorhabdus temperata subsp. temperata M1021]|nr:hypothetical protein B738_05899 [Photorhabdus temperata subsp. temperata M1021]
MLERLSWKKLVSELFLFLFACISFVDIYWSLVLVFVCFGIFGADMAWL